MTDAAFRACYAEWKVIKTRAAVQLVFEIPIEQADEAYQVLGGMPIAAHEVWCGIARLAEKKQEVRSEPPRQDRPPVSAGAEKTKRKFDEMSPAMQSGILCNEGAFQAFLEECYAIDWDDTWHNMRGALPSETAASCVRRLCNVSSRADLDKNNTEWTSLVLAYRLWQREPEVVPA